MAIIERQTINKFFLFVIYTFLVIIIVVTEYVVVRTITKNEFACKEEDEETVIEETKITRGMMILYEEENTTGLASFVNELYQRNIPAIAVLTPEYIQENCTTVQKITRYNIEIAPSYSQEHFWDMSYTQQYTEIENIKTSVEACTKQTIRIISSKDFAWNADTVKVAEELDIKYVLARGTNDSRAMIYKPREYETKIISLSNMPEAEFKYEIFSDTGYFRRAMTAKDFQEGLQETIKQDKIIFTSYTNLSGLKKSWHETWTLFFDTEDILWQTIDQISTTDESLPLWQIPNNRTIPYIPDNIKPILSYEEEENLENPCTIDTLPEIESEEVEYQTPDVGNKIIIFHNETGPMVREALDFIDSLDFEIESHINSEEDFYVLLNRLQTLYKSSSGESESFEYYPIIFIKDKAYSGFNQSIKNEILALTED